MHTHSHTHTSDCVNMLAVCICVICESEGKLSGIYILKKHHLNGFLCELLTKALKVYKVEKTKTKKKNGYTFMLEESKEIFCYTYRHI